MSIRRLAHVFAIPSAVGLLLAACAEDNRRQITSPPEQVSLSATAAGEILVGAGDIAQCSKSGDEATALLLDAIQGTVFTAGDNAYLSGSAADYANCYEPTWGRHKARTRAAIGNREYDTGTADASYDYFGSNVGPRGKGYYSYDLGEWHIVVLNSGSKSHVAYDANSAQVAWLRADLAANTKSCVIAIWHHPRYYSSTSSSSTGTSSSLKPFWDVLYEFGAEIVVNGHYHHYERFTPLNPDGGVDLQNGIRQFVVGTGGQGTGKPSNIRQHSEIQGADFGVIKFTLRPDAYDWEFIPVAGKSFRDSGSGTCHGTKPETNDAPVADAGGPYSAESTVAFSGAGSSDPDGDTPLSYDWQFGDGSTGSGVAPSHTYSSDGQYTVTLTVTDSRGAISAPDQTTVTIANVAPSVDAGSDVRTIHGTSTSIAATFSDPGIDDGPWSYVLAWGDGTEEQGSRSSQSESITGTHTYATIGTYTVRVTVTDKDGGSAWDELTVEVAEPGADVYMVGAGDIARCDKSFDEATASLIDAIEGTVFTLGDNAYPTGSDADFANCFQPSWGRHKSRMRPTPGDKDYETANAAGYYNYFGPVAGDPTKGYYSYDLGDWHIIVLNSRIATNAGSPQEQWLRSDLAANPRLCTLAYWHDPLFYSQGTSGVRTAVKPLWNALYEHGVELVLNGSSRLYERFAKQTPEGVADARGIREIIAGTGGIALSSFGTIRPNSEVRDNSSYGVLKLTLSPTSYRWEFVPIAGKTFTDVGTTNCH